MIVLSEQEQIHNYIRSNPRLDGSDIGYPEEKKDTALLPHNDSNINESGTAAGAVRRSELSS